MSVASASVQLGGLTIAVPVLAVAAAGVLAVAVAVWQLVKRRRRAAAHQATLMAAHEEAVRSYHAAEQAWQRRREEMRSFLSVAELPGDGQMVYGTVPVRLLGSADGETADVEGHLTVSQRGLTFEGSRSADWPCKKIVMMRHVGHARTVLQVQGESGCVIMDYAETPTARLYLDLVLAIPARSRGSFVRTVAQGLNDHEMRRPDVPEPPAPVPGLSRRARTKAATWQTARLAEAAKLRSQVDAQVAILPTQAVVSVEPVHTHVGESLAS